MKSKANLAGSQKDRSMHSPIEQRITHLTESEFVLPKPPKAHSELLVAAEPGVARSLLQRAVSCSALAGARMCVLLDCQELFYAEIRVELGGIRAALTGVELERVTAHARTIDEILDWCDAAHLEAKQEAHRAAHGEQLVDLNELCEDVVYELAKLRPEILVQVHGGATCGVFAKVVELFALVRMAIERVADRVGGHGNVSLSIQGDELATSLWIRANGEPVATMDTVTLQRFRAAATALGVAIYPDSSGPHGTGLILGLAGSR